jgi:ankyrin repeat protein
MLQLLLDQGAKLEVTDSDGETPTFLACTCGNPAVIRALPLGGASPNGVAADGWSYLMMAARAGDYEVAKALLEAGASIAGARDMFGRSALDLVALQMQGMGVRMTQDETSEHATERTCSLAGLRLM